jgi:Rha family phage regulatory protein
MTEIIPTKADLLKTDIVAIDQHHEKVITSSLQIADYFGKRHSNVTRRVTALIKRGLLKIEPSSYLNQQGKEQVYYELSRDKFLLVVLGFTGDKADQFKSDFIKLFNQQEAELKQWRTGRLIASDMTKDANDQIYKLKNDLKKVIPNSRRCSMIFNHFQRSITKAATGSAKTKRDVMTFSQLDQVAEIEQNVQDYIKQLRLAGVDPIQIRANTMAMIQASNRA